MWNKKKKCLLSFHDISVENFDTISPLLEEIRLLAGSPFALLIVPDTKNASLERINAFKKQLKEWKEEGYELLLHGCSHLSSESHKRSYQGLIVQLLTHREAEFAGLNQKDSLALFNKAIDFWDLLDIGSPEVFVPPAWFDNPFLVSQVLKKEMAYESRFVIRTKKKRHYSLAISFAGLAKSLIPVVFFLGHFFLRKPLIKTRIALHPVDFPIYRDRIHDLIRSALNHNQWLQYKDL